MAVGDDKIAEFTVDDYAALLLCSGPHRYRLFFVHQALMSFPNGSSAGLDVMSPHVFKILTVKSNGQTGLNFLRGLTNLEKVILEQKVPFKLRLYFFGGKLIALKKGRWRTLSYCCRQCFPLVIRKMCRSLCRRITSSKIRKSTSRCRHQKRR